jgi:predicted ATPase/DNA-binding CsgD family transcriptional regulator
MSMPLPDDFIHFLPVPRTSLVGREEDAHRISSLLLSGNVPLVTVTGPGGAGKTRLALKVAEDLAVSFRDGVWFVDLSAVQHHSLVLPTIAQAVGMRETDGNLAEHRLGVRLRDAEMLLLLDNFEQVRDAAPQIADLLRASPGLKLLVTSRVILHLSSEYIVPISGLSLPHNAEPVTSLERNDAVRLFVARAQASDPAFTLTEQNAASVAGICLQVDGLPLAIELAAARIRTLSPHALHARLSRRLAVLSSRHQDLPARHRTIRDAVDWSVQLLERDERTMFGRLAIFAGEFSLEAAHAIADIAGDRGYDDISGDQSASSASDIDMLDMLGSLVDQSLLQRVSIDGKDLRFRMLQTVREVALEQLDAAGEREHVGRNHALYFLGVAEEAAPHLTGPQQVECLKELEAALPDLRAAMVWFGEHGETELRLRLAVGLWRLGYTRGYLSEAREWLRSALEANRELSRHRVLALNAMGLLASSQGDTDIAIACHDEALESSRVAGDELSIAVALNGLGDAAAMEGDTFLAQARYEAALDLFRKVGSERGIAGAFTNLGNLAWDSRDLERAIDCQEQAMTHYRVAGDLRGMAWSASNLGTLAILKGQYTKGTDFLRDAIEKYTALADPYGVALTLEGFAVIAQARRQPELEAKLLAAASAIRERIGIPVNASERSRMDGAIDRIKGELGVSFDALWGAGRAMSDGDAIRLALASESEHPITPATTSGGTFGLTRREIEIVRLIAVGKSNKEISDELSISFRTVSTHVSNVLAKLEMANRSALASFAHREGLVY